MLQKIVLIIFLVIPLHSQAKEQAPEILQTDLVRISFDQADSAYARLALQILTRSYEEIAYDLQLQKTDTLHVIIVPSRSDFREYTRGRLPSWTEAFASPATRTMVVKSPRWDRSGSNFRVVLVHELLHLLLHEKVGNRPIPRWLDEGLAIFYSGEVRWKTMTAISKASATNSLIPLQDIDLVLKFHRAKAELAYQESYTAVHYLLSIYDVDALRIIFEGIREGRDMDESFLMATGSNFAGFEREWRQYVKKTYKWFWLLEINSYIWVAIFLLAVLALVIIKIRNRRTVKEWDYWADGE